MRIPAKRSLASCAIMLSGLAALGSPPEAVTRPDLNGTRVRAPGTARVYLIDDGFRRAVPHIPAYEALFRDWECIVEDLDVGSICPGEPLGDSPALLKSGEASGVYFIDGTTRREVANPQVIDTYRFAWERVRDVSAEEMARWPKGEKLR